MLAGTNTVPATVQDQSGVYARVLQCPVTRIDSSFYGFTVAVRRLDRPETGVQARPMQHLRCEFWPAASTLTLLLTLTTCGAPQAGGSGQEQAPEAVTVEVRVVEATVPDARLSPDGRHLAVVILGQPWVVDLPDPKARPLADPATDPVQV